jgi:hypothetical protein
VAWPARRRLGRLWREEPDKLRELATLKLSLEATQAAVINGDILRSEDLIRIANAIGRIEKVLKAKVRQRASQAPAGDLRGKLSSRYRSAPWAPRLRAYVLGGIKL